MMQHTQKTSVDWRFYGLDHLRALAIILVFFYHYQLSVFGHPEWVTTYAQFGWSGVDLFFVLSGFLISSALFRAIKAGRKIRYDQFFLKRFFRIIPAYWVVVALYFCFPLFREREALPSLWRFVTFTQNFGLNIKTHGTFSHAWSLCVEEHFYVALPLTLIVLSRFKLLKLGGWMIVALFISGLALRHYSWHRFYEPHINGQGARLLWYQYIYYPTYTRLDGLLAGVSVATVYVFAPAFWEKISKYGNTLIVISLMVLTVAYFVTSSLSNEASVFGFSLVAIGYGIMVMAALSPSSFLYRWKSRTTTFIAMVSYGIYLTHKGVIHMTQLVTGQLGLDRDGNIVLILCILACLLSALVLYFIVEVPFMRLRERLTGPGERNGSERITVAGN